MRPLKLPTSLVVIAFIVALAGFADATYLTIEHYQNAIPPCGVGSCESVLTSAYSTLFGLPISLFGSVYYLFILGGLFAYLEGKNEKLLRAALILPMLGFIVSLALVSIMAFVLHAYCTYCLGSAAITTVLFILSVIAFTKYRSVDTLTE